MHFKYKAVPSVLTLALSKPRSLSLVFGFPIQPKKKLKIKSQTNQIFQFMEKFSDMEFEIEISYNFLYVYNIMVRNFFCVNCMIRSFGNPGAVV